MTVIVLEADAESVVLAADSQWTNDNDSVFYRSKIREIIYMDKAIGAIATSGDARAGLQLEHDICKAFSKKSNHKDPYTTIQGVVDSFSEDSKSVPPALIVCLGQGFSVDDDGLVLDRTRWAIGSGGLVALGAMWGRRGASLRLALLGCKAAIELQASCGGEITHFVCDRA